MRYTRRQVATGIGATLAASQMTRTVTAEETSNRNSTTIRVMTFNMHHGEGVDGVLDLRRIAGIIWAADPDIVGLQEVDNHWSTRSDFQDEAQKLAKWLGMRYVYAANLQRSPTKGSNGHPRQYGTAVLSKPKYPILDSTNHSLPKIEYSDRYSEQRGLLETTIEINGTNVKLYDTHLGLTAEQRKQQVNRILEITKDQSTPQILVGDFNLTPNEQPYSDLSDRYTDTLASIGVTDDTFPAPIDDVPGTGVDNHYERIDFIFSKNAKPLYGRVIGSLASDHLPVIAELKIPDIN